MSMKVPDISNSFFTISVCFLCVKFYFCLFQRGVGLVATGADKPRSGTVTGGKVSLEDLDGPGSINGVPALEFNIDTIEDKPWNKPGADISGKMFYF